MKVKKEPTERLQIAATPKTSLIVATPKSLPTLKRKSELPLEEINRTEKRRTAGRPRKSDEISGKTKLSKPLSANQRVFLISYFQIV